MRHILALMLASLIVIPQIAAADSCPDAKEIVRTPGEYSWFSNKPGWEGGFYFPFPGTGHSTHISHFTQAQWVQVTNIEKGLGYIICDYKGNYDQEVIRIIQIREDVTKRPKNINWSCKINNDYPSTACTCSGSAGQCSF
ncbi:MAG: hypothetical protein ACHP9Y_02375 [Gammaproteobacteria bacterium]